MTLITFPDSHARNSDNNDSTSSRKELVFGTYRIKNHEVLEIATEQAINAMIRNGIAQQPLIDTAVSYGNSAVLKKIVAKYPNVRIGTKFRKPTTILEDLQAEETNYGTNLYRGLLHKHMPTSAYLVLVQAKADGRLQEIGVSNYTAQQLRELVEELQQLDKKGALPLPIQEAIPSVCQNEFHPFLETTVPRVCKESGIRFEAHSVHTLLEEYPNHIINNVKIPLLTYGQMAIAYAFQRGLADAVAFNSANYNHVLEDVNAPTTLDQCLLEQLDLMKTKHSYARYPGSDSTRFEPEFVFDRTQIAGSGFVDLPHSHIRDVIAPQICFDMQAIDQNKKDIIPSNYANGVPHLRYRDPKNREAHLTLAKAVFVDGNGNTIVFFRDDKVKQEESLLQRLKTVLRKIRRKRDETLKASKALAKPKTCKFRAIEDPEALPVDIPDPKVIQPFIDLVAQSTVLPPNPIRVERGVLFPDGRLDFCKQVAQPSFVDFCVAVLTSSIVKHFLIGNNLALVNDTNGQAEQALGRLIQESKGIETFYLAGNAISKDQIQSLAEAFETAKDVEYIWLKMNPIQTGSFHLGKMIHVNTNIKLLDLFNTGQCNEGVKALLDGYDNCVQDATTPLLPSGLQHLYLDINAITDGGLVAGIVSRLPKLESLFLNVNQLGDEGVANLCDGIMALPSPPPLQRLCLGSNGCSDVVLPKITALVQHIPTLTIVQLGSYKSTNFFQQERNQFTSLDKMMELAKAILANSSMKNSLVGVDGKKWCNGFLGIQNAYDGADATKLVDAVAALGLHINGVQGPASKDRGYATATSRELADIHVQPPPVEHIQSVYRNSM